ncbi:unnamed protein product [Closterium sp. NIES-54]
MHPLARVASCRTRHSCDTTALVTPPCHAFVGDTSVFWGSRAFVRDTLADMLSSRAIPCVFLGFVPDAPGWQFYHPTSRRLFPSQDVMFDEPPPPKGPAPSGVSQVDPLPGTVRVEVAVGLGVARGAASGGATSGGAEPGGAESEGAGSEGVEPGGAESAGVEPGGAEPAGVELGGVASEGAESGVSWFQQRCGDSKGELGRTYTTHVHALGSTAARTAGSRTTEVAGAAAAAAAAANPLTAEAAGDEDVAVVGAEAAAPAGASAAGAVVSAAGASAAGEVVSAAGAVVSAAGASAAGEVVSAARASAAGEVVSAAGASAAGEVVSAAGASAAGEVVSAAGASAAGEVVSAAGAEAAGEVVSAAGAEAAGEVVSAAGAEAAGEVVSAAGAEAAGDDNTSTPAFAVSRMDGRWDWILPRSMSTPTQGSAIHSSSIASAQNTSNWPVVAAAAGGGGGAAAATAAAARVLRRGCNPAGVCSGGSHAHPSGSLYQVLARCLSFALRSDALPLFGFLCCLSHSLSPPVPVLEQLEHGSQDPYAEARFPLSQPCSSGVPSAAPLSHFPVPALLKGAPP